MRNTRVNPEVNYGLGVIVMYRCRFVFGKKCTVLVSDVDNKTVLVWHQGVYGTLPSLSLHFIVNLKLL